MFATISPNGCWCGKLVRKARRSLQAEHLKPALTVVEAKAGLRPRHTTKEIQSIVQHLKQVPDYRARSGPIRFGHCWPFTSWRCSAGRPAARRIWPNLRANSANPSAAPWAFGRRQGRYPAPSQPTFWRLLEEIDGAQLQQVLLQVQEQLRGPAPQNELIALDGKEPKHGGGQSVLTALCVPSQYYLASAMVDTKTNEIPVAQKLFPDLDLNGRFVSLDALHTQTETARDIVLEGGGELSADRQR